MKHLKKFNENIDEILEPQDLLDFSQDLVDAGYNVEYYTPTFIIGADDIISNTVRVQNFDIEYDGYFKVSISDFPITDFQKVLNYMEAFKNHIESYGFILDDFGVNATAEDEKPIIESVSFHFLKRD